MQFVVVHNYSHTGLVVNKETDVLFLCSKQDKHNVLISMHLKTVGDCSMYEETYEETLVTFTDDMKGFGLTDIESDTRNSEIVCWISSYDKYLDAVRASVRECLCQHEAGA